MHAAGKIFVKTYLKAIRDTFFSQYVIFLSNRRGKLKLLDWQGEPPCPLVFSFKAKNLQHVKLKMKKRRQFFIF